VAQEFDLQRVKVLYVDVHSSTNIYRIIDLII